jgi:hypothetical protein
MMPLHYLMERRMLMGIKVRAESGAGLPFSSTPDILWFISIFLSFLSIIGLLIISKSIQVDLIVIFYSVLWLLTLFIIYPIPIYSTILLIILIINLAWLTVHRGQNHEGKTLLPQHQE